MEAVECKERRPKLFSSSSGRIAVSSPAVFFLAIFYSNSKLKRQEVETALAQMSA